MMNNFFVREGWYLCWINETNGEPSAIEPLNISINATELEACTEARKRIADNVFAGYGAVVRKVCVTYEEVKL